MSSNAQRSGSFFSDLFHLTKNDDIRALTRKLVRAVRSMLSDEETVSELTYSDTITYFVDERPDDADIAKGAVLLIPQRSAIRVYFLFLDKDNKPLSGGNGKFYGRAKLVQGLDEELKDAFDGTELLILE